LSRLHQIISFGTGPAAPGTVCVNMATRAALLSSIARHLRAGEGFTLATLNLDHIVKLRRDPAFRAAYAAHTHVVADGNPVVWASRIAGRPVALLPGSELIAPLCGLAAANGVRVALLGSTDATLRQAADRLIAAYPTLRIVARVAPPFGFDPASELADGVLDKVAASGARLCFVALGAPRQELLAMRGAARLPCCGFVSVGAGLDFIAGTQARAPAWVRWIALEWLWRTMGNPRRFALRYAACIAVLPWLAVMSLGLRRDRPKGTPTA
jgi:N-acetylglucosaminyldiphosphoundecaprenol N-acetyl-beta-D-mannosaminyltransferase